MQLVIPTVLHCHLQSLGQGDDVGAVGEAGSQTGGETTMTQLQLALDEPDLEVAVTRGRELIDLARSAQKNAL